MYENGKVPDSAITHTYGVPLEVHVAAAFAKMIAACKHDTGITLYITSPYGGYRDLHDQQHMHDHPQGPISVASPGYSSHGGGAAGFAIDIGNAWRVSGWLEHNASRFHFQKTWSSEAWHYGYVGGFTGAASSTVSQILKHITEGDTMIMIRPTGGYKDGKTLVLVDPFTFPKVGIPQDRADALKSAGVPLHEVTAKELTLISDQVEANVAARAAATGS